MILAALILLPAWISHQNTWYDGEVQKAEIAEIEARRAKIREMASHAGADDEPSKSNKDK